MATPDTTQKTVEILNRRLVEQSERTRVAEQALAEVTAERDRLRAVLPQRPSSEELPYTCQYCRNTLADHLLVFDLHLDGAFLRRVTDLVCGPCGSFGESANAAPHFKAVRLFRLTTVPTDQQDGEQR